MPKAIAKGVWEPSAGVLNWRKIDYVGPLPSTEGLKNALVGVDAKYDLTQALPITAETRLSPTGD